MTHPTLYLAYQHFSTSPPFAMHLLRHPPRSVSSVHLFCNNADPPALGEGGGKDEGGARDGALAAYAGEDRPPRAVPC
jgi:hypothetical protein